MRKAKVYWYSGLSGSGKTTIATKLKKKLEILNYSVKLIDGDDVRENLHQNLGFTIDDIKTNNQLIAELCVNNLFKYDVILVPIISPFAASRIDAREKIGDSFNEVYISAKIETVVKRDTKGLYQKAINGQINNMIGYSSDSIYEIPLNPDLVVDTESQSVGNSVESFYQFVIKQLVSREFLK